MATSEQPHQRSSLCHRGLEKHFSVGAADLRPPVCCSLCRVSHVRTTQTLTEFPPAGQRETWIKTPSQASDWPQVSFWEQPAFQNQPHLKKYVPKSMCSSFPKLESRGLELWVSIQHNANLQDRQTAHPRFWGICRKDICLPSFQLGICVSVPTLRDRGLTFLPLTLVLTRPFPPTFEMTPEGDNCSLGSHHPACGGLCREAGGKPPPTLLSCKLLCDDLPFLSVGLKDLAHFSVLNSLLT